MEVFFYGLFMDKDVLDKKGIHPLNPRKGYVDHYALKIGNRASLIPYKGERAYGILMEVDDEEIMTLYTEKSVADYLPENVSIVTESKAVVSAICYNLPKELLTGTNEAYAQSLYALARRLGFPEEYLEKIYTPDSKDSRD